MFRLFKLSLLSQLRDKTVILWMLAFPILLGTLFYVAFGSIAASEKFIQIPVAYVEEGSTPAALGDMLNALSEDEDSLLSVTKTDLEAAREMLANNEAIAVIIGSEDPQVEFTVGTSTEKSIILSIMTQYKSKSFLIQSVLENHPENLEAAIEQMSAEISPVISANNNANDDVTVQYFYALFSMIALLGSELGLQCVNKTCANLSVFGMRFSVSPMSRFKMIITSFFAYVLLDFVFCAIAAVYFQFILGVNLGVPFGITLLINLMGVLVGISMGMFVGSIGRMGEKTKSGILTAATLVMCFLAGLMVHPMKYLIEQFAPIINRLNPAALISDSFYSICVYGDYKQFSMNIAVMGGWIAVFILASLFMTRRKKYESL